MTQRVLTKKAVRQVLADYWSQYRKHPGLTAIAFLLPATGTILVSFVPPLIVAKLVDIYVSLGAIPFWTGAGYLALLGGLWFLGEMFWRGGLHALIKLEAAGINNLGRIAFLRLTGRDYEFYADNFVGSLTKRAAAFTRSFEAFTDTLTFNIVTNVFPIIFVSVVLWRYSPWIPLILLACLAIVVTFAIPIIRRRSRLVALRHEASSRISGRLSDVLTNILAVKSFARDTQEYASYGTYVDDFTAKYKRAADFQNLNFELFLSPMYVITNVIGLAAALVYAQKLGLPAGAILIVFSYYSQVTRVFWEINRVYRNIESSISEAAEFSQLFLAPPKIKDARNAAALTVTQGGIRFRKANFHYTGGKRKEESFLTGFNLDIAPRQKVGLVGPSGGGKTTITKLLLRFLDLRSGQITIDGQDISKVTQSSLREAIAYVPQEPLLFHRSLFENIAYGEENATRDDVIRAAKLAHADDFISRLPHDYDTLVGERGIKLSGGQRQRVAIARALLKKSSILVLDEATSSLDSESEKYIQEGLWKLMEDKTALVIAHRLSTIKHLDRIIVLDNGRIVEDGTHDELIAQGGLYAKLWGRQSGEFLDVEAMPVPVAEEV